MGKFRSKIFILILLFVAFLVYSIVLYDSDEPQAEFPNELAQNGRILWQKKNCVACHQLYGLGGHLGPDLTNIYSKRTEEYLSSVLHTGTNVMPDFKLNDQEIKEFIAFFKYTNSTGVADPRTFSTHLDGTISQ
ncbi:MAG: cytochrome c [Bacteroidia bacterium]|jgi:nitric oxide reductase subunit C|nr:cytochrome c [Bacteroidia bacterium]MCO5254936.1 cytochrome c [Bacteroidota bacterium]MCZ2131302.1 cytochrome c [Bacteroidia bacterium]